MPLASLDQITSIGGGLKKLFTGGDSASQNNPIVIEYEKVFNANTIWSVSGDKWYKIFGYQFVVQEIQEQTDFKKKINFEIPNMSNIGSSLYQDLTANQSTGKPEETTPESKIVSQDRFYYTLPIPPQNFIIKPIMATRATATMGGVVEETSAVTFWTISLTGTTGTAVGRLDDDKDSRKGVAKKFRGSIATTGLLAGVASKLNQALNKIGGIADNVLTGVENVKMAASSGNPLDAISAGAGAITGAINTALLPQMPYGGSAVDQFSNGFVEMQELQKFLYCYQALKGKDPKRWKLVFRVYKTGQEWEVIVKDFAVQQNIQNPMLYRYQMVLQGWNCKKAGADQAGGPLNTEFNRFGPGGDLKSVNVLTPNQMVSGWQKVYTNFTGNKKF